MYENITFENVLERMLSNIPDDMDKREGSIIYDAIAPCAVEIMKMYTELDYFVKETFADTASRESLIKRAIERGIKPYSASNAVLKGEFNVDVPIGSEFEGVIGGLEYVVDEKISDGVYKLSCKTAGKIGNTYFGEIVPTEYIYGLSTATLTQLLIVGRDEEDTESIRERYFKTFNDKSYGGNVADYIEKTNNIMGVGATKVTPAWNGGGTVKITLLDSEFSKANSELVSKVQEVLDPVQDGNGQGIAPIGHKVTVESAKEVEVNVKASIVLDSGYTLESKLTEIKKVINEYLFSIRKTWANQTNSVVRLSQIEANILKIDGIIDINNTTLNNSSENLMLNNYQIPVLGGVDIVG